MQNRCGSGIFSGRIPVKSELRAATISSKVGDWLPPLQLQVRIELSSYT